MAGVAITASPLSGQQQQQQRQPRRLYPSQLPQPKRVQHQPLQQLQQQQQQYHYEYISSGRRSGFASSYEYKLQVQNAFDMRHMHPTDYLKRLLWLQGNASVDLPATPTTSPFCDLTTVACIFALTQRLFRSKVSRRNSTTLDNQAYAILADLPLTGRNGKPSYNNNNTTTNHRGNIGSTNGSNVGSGRVNGADLLLVEEQLFNASQAPPGSRSRAVKQTLNAMETVIDRGISFMGGVGGMISDTFNSAWGRIGGSKGRQSSSLGDEDEEEEGGNGDDAEANFMDERMRWNNSAEICMKYLENPHYYVATISPIVEELVVIAKTPVWQFSITVLPSQSGLSSSSSSLDNRIAFVYDDKNHTIRCRHDHLKAAIHVLYEMRRVTLLQEQRRGESSMDDISTECALNACLRAAKHGARTSIKDMIKSMNKRTPSLKVANQLLSSSHEKVPISPGADHRRRYSDWLYAESDTDSDGDDNDDDNDGDTSSDEDDDKEGVGDGNGGGDDEDDHRFSNNAVSVSKRLYAFNGKHVRITYNKLKRKVIKEGATAVDVGPEVYQIIQQTQSSLIAGIDRIALEHAVVFYYHWHHERRVSDKFIASTQSTEDDYYYIFTNQPTLPAMSSSSHHQQQVFPPVYGCADTQLTYLFQRYPTWFMSWLKFFAMPFLCVTQLHPLQQQQQQQQQQQSSTTLASESDSIPHRRHIGDEEPEDEDEEEEESDNTVGQTMPRLLRHTKDRRDPLIFTDKLRLGFDCLTSDQLASPVQWTIVHGPVANAYLL